MESRIGPYELIQPLGAGGMAETYLAVRRGPGGFEQRVCLKRVLPGRAVNSSFVELFHDEARLLAHLRYAGIVQVHDFGESQGSYYMALELVDGVDLDKLMCLLREREAVLPVELSLYVVAEVLAALHYAHTLQVDGEPLNIVHRDISPSNVLISRHGEVKLTDFGIAKFRSRRHRTQSGHVKGKIAYMSPEQVRGDDLDARSDLFSVGVILHELLTDVHPFEAQTDIALLSNILSGNRIPTRELLPEAAPELVVVIDALLATEREHRPKSASDALRALPMRTPSYVLKRELEELMTSLDLPRLRMARAGSHGTSEDGVSASVPLTGQRAQVRARRTSRRGRWVVAASAVAALSVGGLWLLRREPARELVPPPTMPGLQTRSEALPRLPSATEELPPSFPIAPVTGVLPTAGKSVEEAGDAGFSPQLADTPNKETPPQRRLARRSRLGSSEASPAQESGAAESAAPAAAPPNGDATKASRRSVGRSGASVSVDDFL